MAEKKEVSTLSTKKEILEAYEEIKKQLEVKEQFELKPEKKIEEKKAKDVVEIAEALSSEGVVKEITNLKVESGKLLSQLSEKLEKATNEYNKIQEAIEIKKGELKEIYEIEKSAFSLATLIEAQRKKREEFEIEMEKRKKELTEEINGARAEWEKEKKVRDEIIKERDSEENKRRKREMDEYRYAFEREKELAKNKFEDEKAKLEKEIILKKEEVEINLLEREKSMEEREKIVSEREKQLDELRKKVESFPKELDSEVNKAIKETTEKIQVEARNRENLLSKEAEGEKKVSLSKIESFEKKVSEQNIQIERLSEQLEKSYQKVQEIAIKAIEGSSSTKILSNIEQMMAEKGRKQQTE